LTVVRMSPSVMRTVHCLGFPGYFNVRYDCCDRFFGSISVQIAFD
jgi:hypothetical protein